VNPHPNCKKNFREIPGNTQETFRDQLHALVGHVTHPKANLPKP
jgi:hypothetical protein